MPEPSDETLADALALDIATTLFELVPNPIVHDLLRQKLVGVLTLVRRREREANCQAICHGCDEGYTLVTRADGRLGHEAQWLEAVAGIGTFERRYAGVCEATTLRQRRGR